MSVLQTEETGTETVPELPEIPETAGQSTGQKAAEVKPAKQRRNGAKETPQQYLLLNTETGKYKYLSEDEMRMEAGGVLASKGALRLVEVKELVPEISFRAKE